MISKTHFLKNQNGASAILVVIVVAMLLGFTALAVDIGYMYSTRNELQNVADAAALAGAGELGRIYVPLNPAQQQTLNITNNNPATSPIISYETQIENAAKATALKNRAAEKDQIEIDSSDIIIGNWDFDAVSPTDPLTPAVVKPDAVRVIARRDSTINNAVSTFFGSIFSFFGGSANTFEVSAVATAALSGASTMDEDILNFPIAISEHNLCGTEIVFSPTNSCAGWHNYKDWPANANAIENKMYGFIKDYGGTSGNEGANWLSTHAGSVSATATQAPPLASGNDIYPSGGNISSLFNGFYYSTWTNANQPNISSLQGTGSSYAPFIALYDFFKFRDGDGEVLDTSGILKVNLNCIPPTPPGVPAYSSPWPADEVWSTTIPVYQDTVASPGCANPNQGMEVMAYADVQVLRPDPTSNNSVTVCISCYTVIKPGRGGGGTAGNVMGSIPNLVQ